MNKFMLKISTILLGAFMTIGAGVSMAGINENVQRVNAAGNNVATYTPKSTSAATESGAIPDGSSVTFKNTYSTKEQITGGNSQTWTFKGYENAKIYSIVLNIKRNKNSGSGKITLTNGGNQEKTFTYAQGTSTYVDYTFYENAEGLDVTGDLVLTIAVTVKSLYCQKVEIEWADATPVEDNFVIENSEIDGFQRGQTGSIKLNNVTGPSDISVVSISDANGNDASQYITVNTFDKDSSSITFSVSKNAPIDIYSIIIKKGEFVTGNEVMISVIPSDEDKLTLNSGETLKVGIEAFYQFKASFDGVEVPNDKLTWNIINKKLDTVDEDNVCIDDKGELTTMCTNETGSFVVTVTHNEYKNLSASCTVTFKRTKPYVEIKDEEDYMMAYVGVSKSITVTAYNFTTYEGMTASFPENEHISCTLKSDSTNEQVKIIEITALTVGNVQDYVVTLSNGSESATIVLNIIIEDDGLKTISWENVPTIELDQGEQLTWDHLTGTLTATYSSNKTETVDMNACVVFVNNVETTLPYFVKTTDNSVGLTYKGIEVTEKATLTVKALTLTAQTTTTGYKKVTEELTDWSGTFLIGYEKSATELYVMKGVDAVNNYNEVTMKDGVVEHTTDLQVATIIAKDGKYAIKIGDNYIYNAAKSSNIKTTTDDANAFIYTISYDATNNCSIIMGNGGRVLRFNTSWGGFRHYTTTGNEKIIQLYKSCEITSMETINVSNAICSFVNSVNATFTCSAEHDLSSETLANLEAKIVEEYAKLNDADKNILKTAESNQAGNMVEQFLSRYDYIFGKYGINDTLGRNTTRNIRSAYMSNRDVKRANSMLLIIGLVGISLVSYGIYSLSKKKEEK